MIDCVNLRLLMTEARKIALPRHEIEWQDFLIVAFELECDTLTVSHLLKRASILLSDASTVDAWWVGEILIRKHPDQLVRGCFKEGPLDKNHKCYNEDLANASISLRHRSVLPNDIGWLLSSLDFTSLLIEDKLLELERLLLCLCVVECTVEGVWSV